MKKERKPRESNITSYPFIKWRQYFCFIIHFYFVYFSYIHLNSALFPSQRLVTTYRMIQDSLKIPPFLPLTTMYELTWYWIAERACTLCNKRVTELCTIQGSKPRSESKITLPRRQTRKQSRFPLMVICPVWLISYSWRNKLRRGSTRFVLLSRMAMRKSIS